MYADFFSVQVHPFRERRCWHFPVQLAFSRMVGHMIHASPRGEHSPDAPREAKIGAVSFLLLLGREIMRHRRSLVLLATLQRGEWSLQARHIPGQTGSDHRLPEPVTAPQYLQNQLREVPQALPGGRQLSDVYCLPGRRLSHVVQTRFRLGRSGSSGTSPSSPRAFRVTSSRCEPRDHG